MGERRTRDIPRRERVVGRRSKGSNSALRNQGHAAKSVRPAVATGSAERALTTPARVFGHPPLILNQHHMKSPRKIFAAVTILIATLASASAADIAGKWKTEFESQIGPIKILFEFKADGEKLTGKSFVERQDQKIEAEIKNGKIVKDEVSFTEPMKFQDQEIMIEYKGKLVGDELKLHRKVGEFAEYDIVAKRVVEPKK